MPRHALAAANVVVLQKQQQQQQQQQQTAAAGGYLCMSDHSLQIAIVVMSPLATVCVAAVRKHRDVGSPGSCQ
jgi:hypothetical protein